MSRAVRPLVALVLATALLISGGGIAWALWSTTTSVTVQATGREMTPVGAVTCTEQGSVLLPNGDVMLSWDHLTPPAPSYVIRDPQKSFVGRTAENEYLLDGDDPTLLSLVRKLLGGLLGGRTQLSLTLHASGLPADSADGGWEEPTGSDVIVTYYDAGLLGSEGFSCG